LSVIRVDLFERRVDLVVNNLHKYAFGSHFCASGNDLDAIELLPKAIKRDLAANRSDPGMHRKN
jgi:hypothetical protein